MLSIFNIFQKIRFQVLVLDTGIAWHAAPHAVISELKPKTVVFRTQGIKPILELFPYKHNNDHSWVKYCEDEDIRTIDISYDNKAEKPIHLSAFPDMSHYEGLPNSGYALGKTISEYGSITYTRFQKDKIIKDLKEFSNLENF